MAARDIRGVLSPAAPSAVPGLLPVEQPIAWPRWDDGQIRLTVVDANGAPVNVTGWTFSWTVRRRNESLAATPTPLPLLSRLGAITSAASGKVAFGVASNDWSSFVEQQTYRHDVVGVAPDGARHQLVPQSTLTVLPAVTQPSDTPTPPAAPTALPYPILPGPSGTWFDVPEVAADPVGVPAAGKVRVWFNFTESAIKVRRSDGFTFEKGFPMLVPLKTFGAAGLAAPASGETIVLYDNTSGVGSGGGTRFQELVVRLRVSHASAALGLKVYERSHPSDAWRVAHEVTQNAATTDAPFTRHRFTVRASYLKIEYTNSANVLTSWEGEVIGDTEAN